jgi:hypothetical protein
VCCVDKLDSAKLKAVFIICSLLFVISSDNKSSNDHIIRLLENFIIRIQAGYGYCLMIEKIILIKFHFQFPFL